MAVNKPPATVEFVVKPIEDLFLSGNLRKLRRVSQGEPYPCQMQTTQTFSCLFRHYAKHNGLKKEDLVFSFTDELLPDQTPESVHLLHQDDIYVGYRRHIADSTDTSEHDNEAYFRQFHELIDRGMHSDVKFLVGPEKEAVAVHKAILSARSEYFKAMFREGGLSESMKDAIEIPSQDKATFCRAMEYIYTNNVHDLRQCSSDEMISLLELSCEYCLADLQLLCEKAASKMINFENLGRFMLLSSSCGPLLAYCNEFVRKNKAQLRQDEKFRSEILENSELGLLLFFAASEEAIPSDVSSRGCSNNKRRRVTEQQPSTEITVGTGGEENGSGSSGGNGGSSTRSNGMPHSFAAIASTAFLESSMSVRSFLLAPPEQLSPSNEVQIPYYPTASGSNNNTTRLYNNSNVDDHDEGVEDGGNQDHSIVPSTERL